MAELDLDLLELNETVLSFESFKLRKQYMLKEMAIKSVDSEPRPNRMKKPPVAGIATNPTSYFRDLYIQDEMRHMLIDKYGKVRGDKSFDGLIDSMSSRPGAFFAQGGELAAEKAGLIQALNKPTNHDYWQYSYYELWKEWMQSIGQAINIAEPVTPAPVASITTPVVVEPIPTSNNINTEIGRAFSALTGKGATRVEMEKSKARVQDLVNLPNAEALARKMVNATSENYKLVQRAYFAAILGHMNIARIFWDKAVSMGVRESADGSFDGLEIISEAIDGRYLQIKFDNIKHELDAIIKFYAQGDLDKVKEYLDDQIENLIKIKSRIK